MSISTKTTAVPVATKWKPTPRGKVEPVTPHARCPRYTPAVVIGTKGAVICRPCRKLETLENKLRGGSLTLAQVRESVDLIQDSRVLGMTKVEFDHEQKEIVDRHFLATDSNRKRKLARAMLTTKDQQFRARIWRALEAMEKA